MIYGHWWFFLHVCLCEGVRPLGTGVTHSCELLCQDWELKQDPLEEQLMLSTTDPSDKLCPRHS